MKNTLLLAGRLSVWLVLLGVGWGLQVAAQTPIAFEAQVRPSTWAELRQAQREEAAQLRESQQLALDKLIQIQTARLKNIDSSNVAVEVRSAALNYIDEELKNLLRAQAGERQQMVTEHARERSSYQQVMLAYHPARPLSRLARKTNTSERL